MKKDLLAASNKIIDRMYKTNNPAELAEVYDDWATSYDNDLQQGFGYTAPVDASNKIAELISDRNVKILDAGCGTGLVGEALTLHGFTDIAGIDISNAMLEVAGKKKVYKELKNMTLGLPLAYEDNVFDLVCCIGTFTHAHASGEALWEFIRILKSGGFAIFTQRKDFYQQNGNNVRQIQEVLEQENKWECVEVISDQPYLPDIEPTVKYMTWVYRVL
jgi:predicted TPR repeat methyltransferase